MNETPALSALMAAWISVLVSLVGGQVVIAESSVSGATVFEQYCEMCHEVGGVGISEAAPPLVDNPNLDDLAYLERVIREGVSGSIEVNGETHDD